MHDDDLMPYDSGYDESMWEEDKCFGRVYSKDDICVCKLSILMMGYTWLVILLIIIGFLYVKLTYITL